ncbi:hypothetical protein ACF1BQ_003535 [Bradyrhizobium sp. RDT10]
MVQKQLKRQDGIDEQKGGQADAEEPDESAIGVPGSMFAVDLKRSHIPKPFLHATVGGLRQNRLGIGLESY